MDLNFYKHLYPCPDCCGNVRWLAPECPHCHRELTANDRFAWAPEWARILLFACTTAAVGIGASLLLSFVGLV